MCCCYGVHGVRIGSTNLCVHLSRSAGLATTTHIIRLVVLEWFRLGTHNGVSWNNSFGSSEIQKVEKLSNEFKSVIYSYLPTTNEKTQHDRKKSYNSL